MTRLAICATPTLCLALALALGLVPALAADTGTSSASAGAVLAEPTKAKRAPDPPPIAVVGVLEDGLAGSCTLTADTGGVPRKGVKAKFDAELIDGNTGTTLRDLGRKRAKTDKEGVATVELPVPRIADFAVLAALLVEVDLGGGKKLTQFEVTCKLVDETL